MERVRFRDRLDRPCQATTYRLPTRRRTRSRRHSELAQTFIARLHRPVGSKRNCSGLTFMDCAKQIARRHAVSNPTRLNSYLLNRRSQSIVGQARRGPDKQRDIIDLARLASKGVAPGQDACCERDWFRGEDDLYFCFIESPVHANRAAIVHVSGDLRAWSQEKDPGVSLRQSVRDAVGCRAMIHVEEDGSSLQTIFGRLRVPITRRDALAPKVVGPALV